MKQVHPTASSKVPVDQTVDSKWLVQHSDRLIYYEFEQMRIAKSTEELFPEELADRIGRTREYVCGIIKNAISRAKSCHNQSSNKP